MQEKEHKLYSIASNWNWDWDCPSMENLNEIKDIHPILHQAFLNYFIHKEMINSMCKSIEIEYYIKRENKV